MFVVLSRILLNSTRLIVEKNHSRERDVDIVQRLLKVGIRVKRDDFIRDFPMRRAMRGNGKPGNSTCFNLFMRVHAKGNGFLMPEQSGYQPYPVSDEEVAVAVFRLLWRRAQAEAPHEQGGGEE